MVMGRAEEDSLAEAMELIASRCTSVEQAIGATRLSPLVRIVLRKGSTYDKLSAADEAGFCRLASIYGRLDRLVGRDGLWTRDGSAAMSMKGPLRLFREICRSAMGFICTERRDLSADLSLWHRLHRRAMPKVVREAEQRWRERNSKCRCSAPVDRVCLNLNFWTLVQFAKKLRPDEMTWALLMEFEELLASSECLYLQSHTRGARRTHIPFRNFVVRIDLQVDVPPLSQVDSWPVRQVANVLGNFLSSLIPHFVHLIVIHGANELKFKVGSILQPLLICQPILTRLHSPWNLTDQTRIIFTDGNDSPLKVWRCE